VAHKAGKVKRAKLSNFQPATDVTFQSSPQPVQAGT